MNTNKFWDFVHEHPILCFLALIVVLDAVVRIVRG